MPREYVLGDLMQIPRGEGRNFDVGGLAIAVFRNHADELFATQAKCPHKAGPLADGLVGGSTLLCPLHELGFDLRTGAGAGHDAYVLIYSVQLTPNGTIQIILSKNS